MTRASISISLSSPVRSTTVVEWYATRRCGKRDHERPWRAKANLTDFHDGLQSTMHTEHPVQREVLIYIHTGDRQHFQSFQKLPINRFDLLGRDSGENDPSPLILFSRDSCTLLKALLTNAMQVTIHARATNALQRYKVRRQHRSW